MASPVSRRAVLGVLGAAATAALTGCTGGTRVPPSSDAPTPTPSSASGPGSLGASGSLPAGGTPGGSPSPSPTRTVQAANGTVTVPAEPGRVVVLGTAELDSALTLGLRPVGAARPELDAGLPGYFPESWLEQIELVGPIGDPDLTAVARLRPDLILSDKARDGGRLAELKAIAPTVLTASTGTSWKQDFQTHAQALGRTTFATATTTAYQDHVHQLVSALGGAGSTKKQQISLLRFVQDADPRIYATQNFLGALLAEVQLGRPAAQAVASVEVPLLSPADLGDADGSTLFYATYGDPAKARTAEFLGSKEWRQLAAVKAHRAFQVNDPLWFLGVGYFAANLILAQLQRFLGG